MNVAIVFTAVILSANALPATKHWEAFKIAHNKTYKNSIEENIRFAVFQENLKRINEHNARYALGQETYTMAVNLFADMTKEEFSKYLNQHMEPEIKMERHEFPKNLYVPYSIDWREKNAVGRVKYQGACGSCWAISAIGAVEGQNAILNGKLVSLSVQQLLDCSKNIYGNDCKGGAVPNGFKYVRDYGIASEADYPYEAKQGDCRASSKKSVLKIKGYKKLEATEEALKNGVGSIGPISVTINAKMLYFYNGGILKDSSCKNLTKNFAHSVLVVGYGTEYGQDYWIVKNSWGKSWGEEGYFRLVTHNKTYKTSVEEGIRFAIFRENLQTINDHNGRYDRGEETYTMGVNKFADMTREEFSQFLRKFRKPEINGELHKFPEKLEVPDAVDWRDQNAVLEVKDQGDCGSCWAFSATGALEAQNVILNGKSISLSEQQLLDCSGDYGNGDCDVGGLMTWAFDYVIDNGIVSEADYPYGGKQGACRASSKSTILKMTGYEQLEGTEESLKNGVGTVGPISGAIYAEPFQFYESGIFSSDSCYNNELYLDHGVLTVGYGVENDQEFWIVKNSWGASWGEHGYLRLARNADNQCGIALATWYPIL